MLTTSKQTTSENEDQQHLEELAKAAHKEYCAERLMRGKKPCGDYSELDEATKEYYRATVRAVLAVLEEQKEIREVSDISAILQESDKALLAGKPVVAHSCLRLATTELTA